MPQFLEATVDNSIPSDLPISLPANNIPEQREKLAVLVSTGKSKEALGFQLISKRNAFQTKMWRDIINCMRPTTWRKTTETLIIIALLMPGSKAIGMFVKVDGVEALQKDVQEKLIINLVLSWKLCKRTNNMQRGFFIINSAFPSACGWYYGIALRPPVRGCQHCSELTTKYIVFKKKTKNEKQKAEKATCEKPWTISWLRNSQQNFF